VYESAQGELRRFNAAAHGGPAFEHHAPKSGFRQICGSDQAVVSRARYDNVETIRLGRRLPRHGIERRKRQRSKRRALHESAPCDSAHPVPPATNRFQVGSSVQVRSLLPFKRFVNQICSVL
jgi:hypothetical protein